MTASFELAQALGNRGRRSFYEFARLMAGGLFRTPTALQ